MITLYKMIEGSINKITLPESDKARVNQLKAEGYK